MNTTTHNTNTQSKAMDIIEIIRITDTREYEEVSDGVFKPIKGSGQESKCARCGKLHEVHAEVKLADGTHAVVGTGCAAKESMEMASRFKSGASAAKRLAKLMAEKAKWERLITEATEINQKVNQMALPEITTTKKATEYGERLVITMDDATVYSFDSELDEERIRCVTNDWRGRRQAELGYTYSHRVASDYLKAVNEQIEKLTARNTYVG